MENLEKVFEKRYPNYTFLMNYMKAAIGKEEINWCDMTSMNLTDFVDYLKSTVSPNSVCTYCAIVKSFLNMVADDVELPTMKFAKILSVRKVPQQNIALTEDEVKRIDDYYQVLLRKDKHNVEKDVLTNFLLECYVGARGSDISALKYDNIKNGLITYVSKKTQILSVIPEHYRVKELFKHKPTKQYSRTTINRILKAVCEKCGINEEVTLFYHGSMVKRKKSQLVGQHTARRSFASILASKGVPVAEISQYMGHSALSMTERYIKIDNKKVSAEAMSFFGA